MPARFRNIVDYKLAQLIAKLRKLTLIQPLNIVRGIDFIQNIQNNTS